MKSLLRKLKRYLNLYPPVVDETQLLALGRLLSNQQVLFHSSEINEYEFKIFSQFGDDGLIQYLVRNLEIANKTFIEFGVENYQESNTRFLLMNNNWSGFVLDGSPFKIQNLRSKPWFWKYDLRCEAAFITKENIDRLMTSTGFKDLGILHIDIDGNDLHILEEMDFTDLNPSLVIMEYNAIFGNSRPICTPYSENFVRTQAHFSNTYYGASLPALDIVARKKGYILVACNEAGNNAYFVRKDLLNEKIKEKSLESAYREAKFRESRNELGQLSYLNQPERQAQIQDLEVFNVITRTLEKL